ncbi:MAG: HAD hydrolase-like protein, partial [Antricoccus sp.]
DMTLIDSHPGIAAVLGEINRLIDAQIDIPTVIERLGPPLDQLLAPWVSSNQMDRAIDLFRALYPDHAITPSPELPGAHAAMQLVRDHGAQIVVITGKFQSNAKLHLEHLQLPYDVLRGARWASGKTDALTQLQAEMYVGDHRADMQSAKAAGVLAVGVSTGGTDATQLRDAGADLVLGSLTEFADWYVMSHNVLS